MITVTIQNHTLPLYLWRLFKLRLKIACDRGDVDEAAYLRMINGLGVIRLEGDQIVKEDVKVLEILAQVLNETIDHPLDKPITVAEIERYFLFHENAHRAVRQELESNPKLLGNIIDRLNCPDLFPTNGIQSYAKLKEYFANNYGGSYADIGMDRAFIEELRAVLLTEKRMLAGQRVLLVTDIRDPKGSRIYLPPNIETILEKFTYKENREWKDLTENKALFREQLRDIRAKHGQAALYFITSDKLSIFLKEDLIQLLLASTRSLNLTQILGLTVLLADPRLWDKGDRLVRGMLYFPGSENLLNRGATAEVHNLRGIMGQLYVANLFKYQEVPELKAKVTRLDLPLRLADAKKISPQFDMLMQRDENGKVLLIEAGKRIKKAKDAAEIYIWRVENSRTRNSVQRTAFAEILQEINLHGNILIDKKKDKPDESIDLMFVVIDVVRTQAEKRKVKRLIQEKILTPLNNKLRTTPGLQNKGQEFAGRIIFVEPRALVDEEVDKQRIKYFQAEKRGLIALKNELSKAIKARQSRFRELIIRNLNLKPGLATTRVAGMLVRLMEQLDSGILTVHIFNRALNELNAKVNGRLGQILSNLCVTVSKQEINQLFFFQRALIDLNTSALPTIRQVRDKILLERLYWTIDFVKAETPIIKLLKESKSGIPLDELLHEFALRQERFDLIMKSHPEWEVSENVVRIKKLPEEKEQKEPRFEVNRMGGERSK